MRRPLLLAAAGTAMLAAVLLRPAPPAAPREAPARVPAGTPAGLYRVESPPTVSAKAARSPPAPVAPPAAATAPPPDDLFPFRFLGRVSEGVVLYAHGRVLTVRATGPLDDAYAVDEIHDDGLVLRHMKLNVTKTLAFTSPRTAATAARRPEDMPQD